MHKIAGKRYAFQTKNPAAPKEQPGFYAYFSGLKSYLIINLHCRAENGYRLEFRCRHSG